MWCVVEMSSSLLLLLDEGDSYLEDRGARLHTLVGGGGGGGGGTRTISGRLFLSTRALFFVPTELSSKVNAFACVAHNVQRGCPF